MKRYILTSILMFFISACGSSPQAQPNLSPEDIQSTALTIAINSLTQTAQPAHERDHTGPYMLRIICEECKAAGTGVDIWEAAGTNPGQVVFTVPVGTTLEAIARVTADDGQYWYQVTLNGQTGFVAREFVKVSR